MTRNQTTSKRRRFSYPEVKPVVRLENDGGVTVKIGRNRATFEVIENPGRGTDKRPPGVRAASYIDAVLPTFKGKRRRGMMSAGLCMTAETARDHSSADRRVARDDEERKAVQYAEWLASRDLIDIGADNGGQVRWDMAGGSKRARAVSFAKLSILIPNWDWVPALTEEILPDQPVNPSAATVKIPRAVLVTSSLTRIGPPLPVAPSCILQVAA